MSLVRFHRNSDLKLLNPKNILTLWDEYTHHKAVSPKVFLQFSSEDVSFLTRSLLVPLNISSQMPQRQRFQTGQEVWAFTLWNECTRQKAVSWNASFWVLFPDISLFAIVFNALQNITFSVLEEQFSNTALWEKRYNSLSRMHTPQTSLQKLLSSIYMKVSPFSS